MKQFYVILFTMAVGLACRSQETPPVETVGMPNMPVPVNSYTGWTNQGLVNYSGTAEVQMINPSDYPGGSGGGNVFFANTPNTYFQISGLPQQTSPPDGFGVEFELFGYDTAHPEKLDELKLYLSLDSGITWLPFAYQRFWHLLPNARPPRPWDLFTVTSLYVPSTDVSKLALKFVQTTNSKTFRIDDIRLLYYYLLPVRFINFSGDLRNGKAALRWRAASDNSNQYFIIEKSEDGARFSAIDQQMAKGPGEFDYQYTDKLSRTSFYRLRFITDGNKNFYSNIIPVTPVKDVERLITAIYPLPAKNALNVVINKQQDQRLDLFVTDVIGKTRMKKSLVLQEGAHTYQLNIKGMEAGVYYLTVVTSTGRQTEKIVVNN